MHRLGRLVVVAVAVALESRPRRWCLPSCGPAPGPSAVPPPVFVSARYGPGVTLSLRATLTPAADSVGQVRHARRHFLPALALVPCAPPLCWLLRCPPPSRPAIALGAVLPAVTLRQVLSPWFQPISVFAVALLFWGVAARDTAHFSFTFLPLLITLPFLGMSRYTFLPAVVLPPVWSRTPAPFFAACPVCRSVRTRGRLPSVLCEGSCPPSRVLLPGCFISLSPLCAARVFAAHQFLHFACLWASVEGPALPPPPVCSRCAYLPRRAATGRRCLALLPLVPRLRTHGAYARAGPCAGPQPAAWRPRPGGALGGGGLGAFCPPFLALPQPL